jgi:SWI/SNF-related matrix-associated actin-dependent regulator of chromatin subfamily A member 5
VLNGVFSSGIGLFYARYDFQFFNTQRLNELYEKEVKYLVQVNQKKDTIGDGDGDDEDQLEPLTEEEQEEKEQLLEEGFSTWTRRDFNTFTRACEKYGRDDIKSIFSEMEGKTEEEVQRYAEVFKERYTELNDYDRIIKNIEKGESKISRKDEIMKAILVHFMNQDTHVVMQEHSGEIKWRIIFHENG